MTTKTKTKITNAELNQCYDAVHAVCSTLALVIETSCGMHDDRPISLAVIGCDASEATIEQALGHAEVVAGLDYTTSTAIKATGLWKSVKNAAGQWLLVKFDVEQRAGVLRGDARPLDLDHVIRRSQATKEQPLVCFNGQQVEWSEVKAAVLAECEMAERLF